MRTAPVAWALPLFAALAAAEGCTTGEPATVTTAASADEGVSPDGGAAPCPPVDGCPVADPPGTDLATPVSFVRDVIPVFQTSCALSASCHSTSTGSSSRLYLGRPHTEPPDPQGILDAIVNQPAPELPSMAYVTPTDPTASYLMHKMDGDTCQFQRQCSTTPVSGCGEPMPQGGCTLDVTWRDIVRRWIAQGAHNN